MFDLKKIRKNPKAFDEGLKRRGLPPQAADILELDAAKREQMVLGQEAQAKRNTLSKEVGDKKAAGEDANELMKLVGVLKQEVVAAVEIERKIARELKDILLSTPNLPADDAPGGSDENDNPVLRSWGERPEFDYQAREHFDLGEALGGMDFESAAATSGARFVVLKGALARLERALGQFMIDLQTGEFGYQEVSTPCLVRDHALVGTGQLPKFADDLFRMSDDLWLIPTAEVTLTNLSREQIIGGESLPRRYSALTQCFRSEAGSAGKDTRGMIRLHQFAKVELVSIVEPEKSDDEHERMLGAAEEVLRRLKLPYQVIDLCTGDLGFGARRTYDLEVWLPGQARYCEISSISNCGDFQARRMNMRYRPEGEKETRFPHTLNGSALAVGRTLVAVMENYQQADGSIEIPEVLQPYMGGMKSISA